MKLIITTYDFLTIRYIFAGMTTSVPSPTAHYVPEPSFTSNKRRLEDGDDDDVNPDNIAGTI